MAPHLRGPPDGSVTSPPVRRHPRAGEGLVTSATLATPASARPDSAPKAAPHSLVRAHQRAYTRTIFIIDAAMVLAAITAAYYIRFGSDQFAGEPGSRVPYVFVVVGLAAVWLTAL